ncbi:MAG: hypothetical protein WKG52_04690 [Variovorax sp.]
MKSIVLRVPFLLTWSAVSAFAEPVATSRGAEQRTRIEARSAAEAHRAGQRAEVKRVEAAAGRRLTPAELAELRQQVRQQWEPRAELVRSAQSQSTQRLVVTPLSTRAVRAPRPAQ